MSNSDLTAEDVRGLFDYDPTTGALINRVKRSTSNIGDRAGFLNGQGYRLIKIWGKKYSAPRVIWLHVTGRWPVKEIDHINLVRDDDRIVNLREADRSQNCANKGVFFKKNSLGYRGLKKKGARFEVVLCIRGVEKYIGVYHDIQVAALAYDVAAKKYHGEFARFNFPDKMHRDWMIP